MTDTNDLARPPTAPGALLLAAARKLGLLDEEETPDRGPSQDPEAPEREREPGRRIAVGPGRAEDAKHDPAKGDEQRTDEPGSSWPPLGRRVLDGVDVPLYVTDALGTITYFNDAAVQFWGRRPEPGELWSGALRLYEVDGGPMDHADGPLARTLRERRPVRGEEAVLERPDGTRRRFRPLPSLLVDSRGTIVGAVNVLLDVTEQRQVEGALRSSAEALRTSNAVKDEFLGLVSHELRTPVTTILGNARLLRDRGDHIGLLDRESMLSDIAAESERLLGIVENLLLLTKLESGVVPDPEPQVLAHVVKTSVESFQRRNRERIVRLESEPRHLIVEADRPYLELLLDNLISNAHKYSAIHEPIDVVVTSTEHDAEVRVLDRGIGLEDTDAERLFTAFYRAGQAKAHTGGLGIGLAACRRVAEALGGRTWAGPREGGGSEFGFALPLSPAPDITELVPLQ
jgi:PAS domain S-box-containing protein